MEANRPTEMMEDAYGFAAHGTFNHESEGTLGAITNAVTQSLDVVSIGELNPARFIVPFYPYYYKRGKQFIRLFSRSGFIRTAREFVGLGHLKVIGLQKGAFKELSKDERTTYLAKSCIRYNISGYISSNAPSRCYTGYRRRNR